MSVAPPSGFQESNSSGLDQGRAYSGEYDRLGQASSLADPLDNAQISMSTGTITCIGRLRRRRVSRPAIVAHLPKIGPLAQKRAVERRSIGVDQEGERGEE